MTRLKLEEEPPDRREGAVEALRGHCTCFCARVTAESEAVAKQVSKWECPQLEEIPQGNGGEMGTDFHLGHITWGRGVRRKVITSSSTSPYLSSEDGSEDLQETIAQSVNNM